MKQQTIEAFQVIGISITTTNKDGQSAKDISALWARFMGEGIADKIPNKIDESILSIYTNYQGDHTKPYDTILACRVSSLDTIPEGMVGHSFDGGTYGKFIAKGDLSKGIIYGTWTEIWEQNLDRVYTADFEIYGEKAKNPADAEVEVLVAIKS